MNAFGILAILSCLIVVPPIHAKTKVTPSPTPQCVPAWSSVGPCMAPNPGMCSSCTHGAQFQTANNCGGFKTQYIDCGYVSSNVGSTTTTSTSGSQSGSTSASSTSTTTVSGTGSASSSSSASGSSTFALDGGTITSAAENAYTALCNGADITSTLTSFTQAFVQACANQYASCAQSASSTGGGSTSGSCSVTVSTFQTAVAQVLQSSFASIQNSCSAAYVSSNPLNLNAQFIQQLTTNVWTQLGTWGTASAHIVVSSDVSAYVSATVSLFEELMANVCGCSPNCQYCSSIQTPPCTGSGCSSSSITTNGVTLTGNTYVVNSNYYTGGFSQLDSNAWTSVYSLPCGQVASIQTAANAFAQAVGSIAADVQACATVWAQQNSGSGAYASGGASITGMANVCANILTTFFATAETTAPCPGGSFCPCVNSTVTSASTTFQANDVADWIANFWQGVWASSNGGWNQDSFNTNFANAYNNQWASITQSLYANVGTCVCQS